VENVFGGDGKQVEVMSVLITGANGLVGSIHQNSSGPKRSTQDIKRGFDGSRIQVEKVLSLEP
jgi:hypothetical protein